jgi:hypothetical protein
MRLDFDAQRRYCAKLGLIPDTDDRAAHEAWWNDPTALQVSSLLSAMETQMGKINSAALDAVRDGHRRQALRGRRGPLGHPEQLR